MPLLKIFLGAALAGVLIGYAVWDATRPPCSTADQTTVTQENGTQVTTREPCRNRSTRSYSGRRFRGGGPDSFGK